MAWHDAEKLRDHPDVDAYISDLEEPQRAICNQVRARLKEDLDVVEFIAWGVPCYWRRGPLCYTSSAAKHVTLGFFRGMEIGNGLVGTGKSPVGKHVWKVRSQTPEQFEAWVELCVELDAIGSGDQRI